MTENQKPMVLERKEYEIVGTGNPGWGDPRNTCNRQFSKHVIWLCRKRPMSAVEIAEELNVPTVYVEEELDILAWGENGKYGLLRRMENGRYVVNFVLLTKEEMEEANRIYAEQLPMVSDVIIRHVQQNKENYLNCPYLNRKIDFNLILWQQIVNLAQAFSNAVQKKLKETYFSEIEKDDRPFSVFGYENTGKRYGCGCDGIYAENVCGYSAVYLQNIYIARINRHFHCGHNISQDRQLQLAIRAINGLPVGELTEEEKEHAAKAIECGYLYREGDMLYTKILVSPWKERSSVFEFSWNFPEQCFEAEAERVAEKIAGFIKKTVPKHLFTEWDYVNALADLPTIDALVEILIEKGLLVPPEDGIGAEGCWMFVEE